MGSVVVLVGTVASCRAYIGHSRHPDLNALGALVSVARLLHG